MNKTKLEKLNSFLNYDRIQLFINSFNHSYNNNILKMNYKYFGNIQKRFEPEDYIKLRYTNYTLPEKIKLKQINNNVYNLTEQFRFNLFYNLELELPVNFDLTKNIIFSIKNKENIICSISLFGCDLFCFQKRNTYKIKNKIILPIYLFECFEKKYIDINDFDNNIYLTIENINYSNIELYCSAIVNNDRNINRDYCEFIMNEKNDFLNNNAWINNNEKYNFIHSSIDNSNKFVIDFNNNYFTQLYYFSLFYENNRNIPEIKEFNVEINKNTIPFNSSKILLNNSKNFHVVSLFPDSSTDLIKDKKIFGINFANYNNIKNNITLKNKLKDNIYSIIGFITYNIIVYKEKKNLII